MVPQSETRSTQRAQTSAELQFFPDPDRDPERTPGSGSDADRHQNVISWSPGHAPALHKISSKSVGNFFGNPVNPDFGLRTPGSGR